MWIETLKPDEIFVFGSNLAGKHLGGAAKQAFESFGAVWGVGEGLTGQCYALPTLDKNLEQRNDEQLTISVRKLFKACRENPDKKFLLTPVGTGIASYDGSYMKSLFKNSPANLILPEEWL